MGYASLHMSHGVSIAGVIASLLIQAKGQWATWDDFSMSNGKQGRMGEAKRNPSFGADVTSGNLSSGTG